MEEKATVFSIDSNDSRFFLVNHGNFYGREITCGMVFVPDRDAEASKLIKTVRPGDLFFHLSSSGISALGRAISMPYKTPFPFWRHREEMIGGRGLSIEIEVFLLPDPIPINAEMPYLTALSKTQAKSFFEKILECFPKIVNAEWIKTVFPVQGF